MFLIENDEVRVILIQPFYLFIRYDFFKRKQKQDTKILRELLRNKSQIGF